MASRPKRKKRSNDLPTERPAVIATGTSQGPTQPQSPDVESMVKACMATIIPTIEKTCREIISQQITVSSEATSSVASATVTTPTPVRDTNPEGSELQPAQSLLQDITGLGIQNQVSPYGQRTDTSPSFSSKDLSQAADLLLRGSLSKSTTSAYKSIFQSYKQFVELSFPTEYPLPPSLQHLSAFVAHCYLKGSAASTVRTLVSALSFTFQLGGFTDITEHFIVKKMLQGFQKIKPSSDTRLPITPNILKSLLLALEHTTPSFFTKLLLRAMFLVAFCAFLRIGEITKTSGATQHYILVRNVALKSDAQHEQYIEVSIPHFKHARSPTSIIRLHRNRTNPNLCPHQSLMQYLDIRKHDSPSEPLFSFMDGAPVSRQFFTQQLRSALSFCNLNLHHYQTHSFRIGAATTAAARGYSELQIQNMGRWKSNAFKKYIRIPTLEL